MPKKSKFEEEAKTKPGRKRPDATSAPPSVRGATALAKKKASEAPTEPPPAPEEAVEVVMPKNPKVSGVRPRGRTSSAATIDEVTADMRKDPRRDDD